MHYYQFNIGDYASHTRNLSLLEDLAYRKLLDEYYLHERPLNGCITDVARQIGMKDYQAEVAFVLKSFFTNKEDAWINKRADREITHYASKLDQASRAGKASAEVRRNGRSTDVQPTNNQQPITNNHKTLTSTSKTIVAKSDCAARSTRFSDESLSESWKSFCLQERPELNPEKTFAKFRDYWIAVPGQKGSKLDWLATWRNWVRNQNPDKINGKAEPLNFTAANRRILAKIENEEKLAIAKPAYWDFDKLDEIEKDIS